MRHGVSLLLGLLCLCIGVAADSLAADRPNVLVIMVDDLGYGDLACYGADDMQTPHIDRLVASGMKFDRFYANCPVCSPTRAALLTGCYPDLVGVPGVIRTHPDNNWGYLDPAVTTLADEFSHGGYATAAIGKWHLGLEEPNIPNKRGFDEFYGYLGDMMDDYYDHRRHGINYMRRNKEEVDPEGHATDLFTQWACEYLESRKTDKPFFLYLAYNAPHTPIQPPDDWLARVKEREQGIDDTRAKLVALIEHMDDGIGRVMQALDEHVAGETIVVFTSDNGGQLNVGANNGPLRDGKQSMYEGGLRVPMAVVWPVKISAGSRTDFMGMTMDLYPTLLAAAGVSQRSQAIDGRSFLPTLLGDEQPQLRRDWFFRRREGGITYGGKTIEAVRRGPWKLLQNTPFEPQELYNLETDPLEEHDVKETEPQVFRELAAALRGHIQRGGAVPWQAPGGSGDR